VVVGALNGPLGGIFNQGAAYVFVEPALGWAGTLTETASLTAPDVAANDEFTSVAISGNTVVVGADDAGAVGGIPGQGAAYVFVEPKAGWAGDLFDAAKLTASDGTFGGVRLLGRVRRRHDGDRGGSCHGWHKLRPGRSLRVRLIV
jgi:hypothetical protein